MTQDKRLIPVLTNIILPMIAYVKSRPKLFKWVQYFVERAWQKQGSRQLGLMKDDLLPEDHPLVNEAMKRLTEKELNERAFRQQRASEVSFRQEILPKELHMKAEDDVRYLTKHILDVVKEQNERKKYEK